MSEPTARRALPDAHFDFVHDLVLDPVQRHITPTATDGPYFRLLRIVHRYKVVLSLRHLGITQRVPEQLREVPEFRLPLNALTANYMGPFGRENMKIELFPLW